METYERYKEAIDNYEFHGTEQYYKPTLFPVLATDGSFWFINAFECFWLFELISAFMMEHQNETFMVAEIKVENEEAWIKFNDGNDNYINKRAKHINYTNMPTGEYTLWCANTPGNSVIYLNTEH